jgi:hypothetical protein
MAGRAVGSIYGDVIWMEDVVLECGGMDLGGTLF